MHMSDALLSPAVGGAMWLAAGSALAYAARKVQKDLETDVVPLMGALGAFVFAAQMINFTIPGTGSSGHLAGGMLLAILLGPSASLIALSSVLIVQALFFADGGILALGANIVNLGVIASFLAYPLVYRPLAGPSLRGGRLVFASVVSSVFALTLGSILVVLQTVASGISELPFGAFLGAMVPIHLAIGTVEGVVTAIVVTLVAKAEPGVLQRNESSGQTRRNVVLGFIVAAVILGGFVAWFASSNPDGLEWSILRVAGQELEADAIPATAVLPDYTVPNTDSPQASTSLSGLLGAGLTFVVLVSLSLSVRAARRRRQRGGHG